MRDSTPYWLYRGNADFIEDLYESFLGDPDSVSTEWRDYFTSLQQTTAGPQTDRAHSVVRESFLESSRNRTAGTGQAVAPTVDYQKQVSVLQLINAYRFRGHQQATLDPLNQNNRPPVSELDPAFHNLAEADMDRRFNTGSLSAPSEISLREILNIIRTTYCGNIGAEYMHINETEQKRWIQQRPEVPMATPAFVGTKMRAASDVKVGDG